MENRRGSIRSLGAVMCAAAFFAGLAGCGGSSSSSTPSGGTTFTLSSSDITNSGTIGATYVYDQGTCTGSNQSPQLSWSSAPSGTQTLVVTVVDTSASNFVHWILYDIPSTTISLARNASATGIPAGATQTANDYPTAGYGGPCPPMGETHSYQFKVWALTQASLAAIGSDISTNANILAVLQAGAAGSATITASYTRP